MEIDRSAICARIKEAREAVGLTQEELGEVLDPPAHRRTVQTWESTLDARVPWDRLSEIARICRRTTEWLIHGDELPVSLQDLHRRLEAEVDRLTGLADELERRLAQLPAQDNGVPRSPPQQRVASR